MIFNENAGTFLRFKYKVDVVNTYIILKLIIKKTKITFDYQDYDSITNNPISAADPRDVEFTTEEQGIMNLNQGD